TSITTLYFMLYSVTFLFSFFTPHSRFLFFFFFFTDTATTEIYTLSLHDALPIWGGRLGQPEAGCVPGRQTGEGPRDELVEVGERSEEHTSELQSRENLVCRLLLEKKKKKKK